MSGASAVKGTKEMTSGFKGVNQEVANASQKAENSLNAKIEAGKYTGAKADKATEAAGKLQDTTAKYSEKAGSTLAETQAAVDGAGAAGGKSFAVNSKNIMQFGGFLQSAGSQLAAMNKQNQTTPTSVATSYSYRRPGAVVRARV